MKKTTKKVLELLELVEDGVLSYGDLATAALNYMSEDEVKDMAQANELLPEESEPNEEKEDHT